MNTKSSDNAKAAIARATDGHIAVAKLRAQVSPLEAVTQLTELVDIEKPQSPNSDQQHVHQGDECQEYELVDVLRNRVAEGHPIHVTGQPSKEIISSIESVAQGIAEETGQIVQIVNHIELK